MVRTRVRWHRVLGLAVGALLAVDLAASRVGSRPPERTTARVYVVRTGDTLWDIARRQAGSREDPRPIVDRLIRVNHLRGALISPGQQLLLPT